MQLIKEKIKNKIILDFHQGDMERLEKTYYKMLCERIMAIFRSGFLADADIVQYIESVLAPSDIDGLREILEDEDNCDRASLVDLVVSPDITMQQDLEGVLTDNDFAPEDIQEIISFFPSTVQASLSMPEEAENLNFSIFTSSIARFVDQLNITRKIHRQIQEALENRLPDPQDVRLARVMIRNARRQLTDSQAEMLVEFVKLYNMRENKSFFEAMGLLLEMLGRQDKNESAFDALGREKQRRLRQVRDTEQVEEKLAGKNVETLMIQGSRGLLVADKGALFKEIGIIDRISLAVFGKMPRSYVAEAGIPISFEKTDLR